MKPAKHIESTNILGFYLPVFIFIIILCLFAPRAIIYFTYSSYLFILLTAIIIAMPRSKIRLGTTALNSRTFIFRCLRIIALQLLMYICILGIAYAALILSYKDTGLVVANPWRHINLQLFLSWGALPWTLTALLGATFAYIKFTLHRDGSLFDTARSVIKSQEFGAIGAGGEIFFVQGMVFFAALSLGIFVNVFYLFLGNIVPVFQLNTLSYSAMGLLTIALALSLLDPWQNFMTRVWKQKLLLGQIMFKTSGLFLLGLLIVGPLLNYLFSDQRIELMQGLLSVFKRLDPITAWNWYVWAFIISGIPLIARRNAELLKGMSLRAALLVQLPLPIIGMIATSSALYLKHEPFILAPLGYAALIVTSGIVLGLWIKNNVALDEQIKFANFNRKKNPLQMQLPLKFIRVSAQLMFTLPLLYWVCGFNFISVFYFAMVAMCWFVYLICILGLIPSVARILKPRSG